MKYNAVMVSVFDTSEMGFIECKKVMAIPTIMRMKSVDEVFSTFLTQQRGSTGSILAIKFMKTKGISTRSFMKFKLIRESYQVIAESQWYINPVYDYLGLVHIHKLAEPAILLQCDMKHAKYRINYYVDLRLKGYSEDEAMSLIYG